MNRFRTFSAMVLAASFVTGGAAFASPLTPHSPLRAMFGKTHTVSFRLRNDSTQPVRIKAGDQDLTLEPGKATSVKLNVGDKVIVSEATSVLPAGSVITTAESSLSDATISFK